MALPELLSGAGSFLGGAGSAASGASTLLDTLFGSSGSESVSETRAESGRVTEQLQIDAAGVEKILQDILASEQGLAPIFSEENVSGIYNSTAASAAAGDLMTRLAGEIAKLTAKKVKDTEGTVSVERSANTVDKGLIGGIFRS